MNYVRETGRLVATCARRLHEDQRGQAMTEYTVLLCAVVAGSIALTVSLGATLLEKFTFLDAAMGDFKAAVTANLGH